jgi:hypothetical protein
MTADIGKALRAKLLGYAGVAALVSQRMYPNALVQNARMPAIVYSKISTQREHAVSDITRLAHARFQLDCYATTVEAANDVFHAIRTSGICAFQGTSESITFFGCEIENDTYQQEPPTDGSQEHRYITSFDIIAHYQEVA